MLALIVKQKFMNKPSFDIACPYTARVARHCPEFSGNPVQEWGYLENIPEKWGYWKVCFIEMSGDNPIKTVTLITTTIMITRRKPIPHG
jgi:hypothetical protein